MLYEIEGEITLTATKLIEAENEQDAHEIAADQIGAGEWDFTYENWGLHRTETVSRSTDETDDECSVFCSGAPVYHDNPRVGEEFKRNVVRQWYRHAAVERNPGAGLAYLSGVRSTLEFLGADEAFLDSLGEEMGELFDQLIEGQWS